MIKFENTEIGGFDAAIREVRNITNSFGKGDSFFCQLPNSKCSTCEAKRTERCINRFLIGYNDLYLAKQLRNSGIDYRKFMRIINVYVDITAPLYWWAEFDMYKIGTAVKSCSTMDNIVDKPFKLDDFSHEHLNDTIECHRTKCGNPYEDYGLTSLDTLNGNIEVLNFWRKKYLEALKTESESCFPAKDIWRQITKLLPSSYNQRRTVAINYEGISDIYRCKKDDNLDEWCAHPTEIKKVKDTEKEYVGFCDWIEELPYSELIITKKEI